MDSSQDLPQPKSTEFTTGCPAKFPNLPTEILVKIIKSLELKQRVRLERVSTRIRFVVLQSWDDLKHLDIISHFRPFEHGEIDHYDPELGVWKQGDVEPFKFDPEVAKGLWSRCRKTVEFLSISHPLESPKLGSPKKALGPKASVALLEVLVEFPAEKLTSLGVGGLCLTEGIQCLQSLKRFVQTAHNLEAIDFRNALSERSKCLNIAEASAALAEVFRATPKLREVSFMGSILDGSAIATLPQTLANFSFDSTGDGCLPYLLASPRPRLETLRLAQTTLNEPQGMTCAKLVALAPNLRHLQMRQSIYMKFPIDISIDYWALSGLQLESLNIALTFFSADAAQATFNAWTQESSPLKHSLTELNIENSGSGVDHLGMISGFPHLRVLGMTRLMEIKAADLEAILKACLRIEKLDISYTYSVEKDCWNVIGTWAKNLTWLGCSFKPTMETQEIIPLLTIWKLYEDRPRLKISCVCTDVVQEEIPPHLLEGVEMETGDFDPEKSHIYKKFRCRSFTEK